jgi:hypothetical protein
MEFTNTFENGMHKDNNVLLQPSGTYRDMNNGMLVSYDGNHYVVEMPKGSKVSFTIPPIYKNVYTTLAAIPTPIGFISFLDKLVVFSTNNDSQTNYGEIGVVEFDHDGIGTYTPLYNHAELNFSIEHQIRGFSFEENDAIKRVYWTDYFNSPRVLNTLDVALQTNITSGTIVADQEYMVVRGAIEYNDGTGLKIYGPGLTAGNIFTGGAISTFTTINGSPIVYKYIDLVLLDWVPDRTLPDIDFKEPIVGSLFGGSKSYFVRYKLKAQGITTSWSYGSFPINVYSIGAYSSYTLVEGSGASALQNTTAGVRLTVSNINTYFDTIEVASATFDEVSNTLTRAEIFATLPITSSSMNVDHTTEGAGEALTLDDLTIFPASIFKVKDITTNKNYNVIGNIVEREELTDFDGTTATVSNLTYNVPADQNLGAPMNAGIGKQSASGIFSGGIIADGHYVVTTGNITYMGNIYGPAQPLGPYFTGVYLFTTFLGTGTVKANILIKKYKSQSGFNRYKSIELNDDYFDYRGFAATQYLRQYWSGETYRIGILPYDKKGNPMYARWIDDFTIQTLGSKNGPTTQRGNGCSLNVNGLSISGITFSADDMAKISGFSIVRAPRDKVYTAQGVLFQTTGTSATLNGSIMQQPLCQLSLSNDYIEGGGGNSIPFIMNWYSPDEMFEYSGFTGGANNYLEGDCFINPLGSLYGGSNDQANTKFYRQQGAATPQTVKITRYDGVNPGGSITDYYAGTDYDNNLTHLANISLPSPWTSDGKAVGCKTIVVTMDSGLSFPDTTSMTAMPGENPAKPLMNYKIIKANLYGGTSERALANTIYISTGHYQRIDSSVLADTYDAGTNSYIFDEVEVFGGDSFLTIMSLGKSLYDDVQYNPSFSYGIFYPVESNCNPYLRQGRNIGQYGMHNNPTFGVYYNISGNSRLEQFLLNDAYATDGTIIAYPALPDVSLASNFPYRTRWAGAKTLGESTDSFRTFLQNSFRDLDGNKGPINNIRQRDGKVFYWQDHAVGYLPILERQLVNGDIGEATQLGVGGVIDRFDTFNTYFGNQNTNGLVETEYGFAWFDYRRRAMLAMSVGGGIQEVSFVKGLETFFNESTRFDTNANNPITDDKPLTGNGICGVYDPMYKMTYISFKWKESDKDYRRFTIGYYHPRNIFVGFFDLEPSILWNHNNLLIGNKSITADVVAAITQYFVGDKVQKNNIEYTAITNFQTDSPISGQYQPDFPNSVYWIKTTQSNETNLLFSTTNFCKFFGYTYNHDIEIIVNPKTGKPFAVDNLIQKSNDTNYDSVLCTTDDDTSTDLTSNNKFYRYYDRGWHSSIALGAKGRLVDYYLKVKLSITNYSGNPTVSRNLQKIFNFVTSVFREKK